jgi:guanylate kinase
MPPESKKNPFGSACLFAVSAPSGTGKTTLCRALLKRFPDMAFSISHTTRKPRPNETDGVDYHFISKAAFKEKIKRDLWAEWEEIYGEYYGTSAELIEGHLSAGRDALLDIDVKGALQMRRRYPFCVAIFIMPPSLQTLKERLESRGTETSADMEKRLAIAEKEMEVGKNFRHVIVNDRLDRAFRELEDTVLRYRGQRPKT